MPQPHRNEPRERGLATLFAHVHCTHIAPRAHMWGCRDTPYPDLEPLLAKYQDPHEADSLSKIHKDLDETKVILVRPSVTNGSSSPPLESSATVRIGHLHGLGKGKQRGHPYSQPYMALRESTDGSLGRSRIRVPVYILFPPSLTECSGLIIRGSAFLLRSSPLPYERRPTLLQSNSPYAGAPARCTQRICP